MDRSYYGAIERGEFNLSVDTVLKLSAALDLQTAMPLAIIGVFAGIVGNLPSLGRGLQAILLGPVVAGLTGGLAALTVIALALTDDRKNRGQLVLPEADEGARHADRAD
jgi:hypothetical protein